jgi:hypothetical protein
LDRYDSNKNENHEKLRKLIFGSLFLILLLFSIIFSMNIQGRNALGDVILKNIGLKPWSGDTGGFHNTILYSLVMFMIGFLGGTYFLKDLCPKLIKRLPLLLFICFLLLPSLSTAVIHTVKGLSSGLDAIDYDREESYCEYETDGYGNLIMSAHLPLCNYSNKTISLSVKLIPDETFADDVLKDGMITANISGTQEPIVLALAPHSTAYTNLYFRARVKDGVSNVKGSMSQVDIIIFTEDEEKTFIKMP